MSEDEADEVETSSISSDASENPPTEKDLEFQENFKALQAVTSKKRSRESQDVDYGELYKKLSITQKQHKKQIAKAPPSWD